MDVGRIPACGNDSGEGLDGFRGAPEGDQENRRGRRPGQKPQDDLREDAQGPFRADQEVDEVVARDVLHPLAAHLHDLAGGQHGLQAQDVMPRDAVLDGPSAACVFGQIAPDEAGLEAHGIARIEKPELLDSLADLAGHHAGLHDGHHVFPVDLQDPVHPLEGKHDAPVQRHGAAGKPRSASAGRYGDTVPVGDFHDFRDLAGARRA